MIGPTSQSCPAALPRHTISLCCSSLIGTISCYLQTFLVPACAIPVLTHLLRQCRGNRCQVPWVQGRHLDCFPRGSLLSAWPWQVCVKVKTDGLHSPFISRSWAELPLSGSSLAVSLRWEQNSSVPKTILELLSLKVTDTRGHQTPAGQTEATWGRPCEPARTLTLLLEIGRAHV